MNFLTVLMRILVEFRKEQGLAVRGGGLVQEMPLSERALQEMSL